MSEYVKFATSAADQYLSSLAEAQDAFLKSMTPYSDWASAVPKMPAGIDLLIQLLIGCLSILIEYSIHIAHHGYINPKLIHPLKQCLTSIAIGLIERPVADIGIDINQHGSLPFLKHY